MQYDELYVSIDIEADGPIPGEYSMLSMGSATFDSSSNIVGTFERNLKELPKAKRDKETMNWWATEPKAWKYCRKDPIAAKQAMQSYLNHLLDIKTAHKKDLICIGYPVTYDFMFVYWYLIKFTGTSPFSFSGIDIKTMAMATMKSSYKKAGKKYMPAHWFNNVANHNHTPLEDAIEQGQLFCNILRDIYKQG